LVRHTVADPAHLLALARGHWAVEHGVLTARWYLNVRPAVSTPQPNLTLH
jgi:hypothetical protein